MDENPVTGFFSHEKKHKKNVHLRYFSFHIVYQLSVHLDKRERESPSCNCDKENEEKADTGRMWLEITFPFIIPALLETLLSSQCPLFICLPSLDVILVYHAMHLLFYYALLSLPTKSGIQSNREDGNLKETTWKRHLFETRCPGGWHSSLLGMRVSCTSFLENE